MLLLMGGFIAFIRMWHYFDSNRLVLRLESNITSPGRFNPFHGDPRLLCRDSCRASWTERFNIPRALLRVRAVAPVSAIGRSLEYVPQLRCVFRLSPITSGAYSGFLALPSTLIFGRRSFN